MRRVSQLDLSLRSGVSPRHVSFLETGRSRPGREIILRLAEALDVPSRDRNELLRSAGFGPAYGERALDDRELAPFRQMLQRLIEAHEPFPALIITTWWDLVDANRAARQMIGLPFDADVPQINLMDVFLSGNGRERFVDYPTTAHSLFDRLRREAAANPHPKLLAVLERSREALRSVPRPPALADMSAPAFQTSVRVGTRTISTVAAVARFTDPMDATLDDLRVELMFAADDATEAFFREAARDG